MTDLQPGWAVQSNEGRRLGTVKDVGQNYVRTAQAGSGPDLYIPASAIAMVANGILHLNVTFGDAHNMGWQQPPRTDDTLETSPESDLSRHV